MTHTLDGRHSVVVRPRQARSYDVPRLNPRLIIAAIANSNSHKYPYGYCLRVSPQYQIVIAPTAMLCALFPRVVCSLIAAFFFFFLSLTNFSLGVYSVLVGTPFCTTRTDVTSVGNTGRTSSCTDITMD